MTSSHEMSHTFKMADNAEKEIGRDAEGAEGSLQPITDSLPPHHEHDKSLKQELQEIDATETDGDGGGAALSRAPSRKDVLASKARLIALVLTLTGASFLNVSHIGVKRCGRSHLAPKSASFHDCSFPA